MPDCTSIRKPRRKTGHDLIIRNGTVIDGTGNLGVKADVAINGERITTVGDVSEAAYQTIDATGKLVTPGFIDTHTHMDAQFMWDPQLEMLSEDLWDEYLWGELGAAVRDFENEPWGKPSEEDTPESR